MPSPACEVKDGAGAYQGTDNGVDVTPTDTITIRLISSAGVDSWSIVCITSDELSNPTTITSGLTIDYALKTASFTAPVAGRALRFRSLINGGIGPDGVARDDYSATFCIYTLVSSRRVVAADETTESDPTFGWISGINDVIRNPSGGSGVDVKDEGGSLGTFTSLNFAGAGVTATDAGGSVALVTIPGGGGSSAVVFDDSVPATDSNIRSDRAANQGTIDNTKTGVTQLGSDTAAGPGVTANYATVGGGDQHQISGQYGVVAGGLGNAVTGIYGTCAGGQGNSAGDRAFVAGQGCSATSRGVAIGQSCTASGLAAVALGESATASQEGATACSGGVASDYFSFANGDTGYANRYAQHTWGSGQNASSVATSGQSSLWQCFGTSVGGATAHLQDNGSSEFVLNNGKAYELLISVVARSSTGPTRTGYRVRALVGCQSGAATIDFQEAIGTQDPTATGWTFTVGTDGANAIRFSFAGGGAVTAHAIARIDFVEVS